MSENNLSDSRGNKQRRKAPSPRKSERTRQAILDAALEFLWTHPFRDLTVAGLTELAGTSRPAFYQYFDDLHDLMETLLNELETDIMGIAMPWFEGEGDPVAQLKETLAGLVKVCYQRGPILKAVSDAAASDKRLERAWAQVLEDFDEVIEARILVQQELGVVPQFPARPVAEALNRLDASLMIEKFGRRPRANPVSVCEALTRIWISTLYGIEAIPETVATPRSRKSRGKLN